MLFTENELEQLRQEALIGQSVRSQTEADGFSYDADESQDKVNVLWNEGDSSDLFRGGNEFWDMYPAVN